MKGDSFFFKGGDTACLLIHGFTSSAQEVEELGKYLADKGFTVKGVLLKGHNTSPADLNKTTWQDWYNDVDEQYRWLNKHYKKIYVIGLSMGAVLALHLAANNKVTGIVALAPALFFQSWKANFAPVAKHFMKLHKKNYNKHYPHRKDSPWDILSDEAYNNRLAYKIVPVKALASSLKLIGIVKKELKKIISPILLIHSKKDHTIKPESIDYIYDNIGSQKKKKIFLEQSGHVITVDVEKNQVFKAVSDFLSK